MKLVFATNNPHKIQEVNAVLGGSFEIIGLKDIGCTEELPETHETIRENAQEKAQYVYQHYQVDCFSEDSGLEIDALNGEPGVHTAHYSGSRDADANIQLVLDKMAGKTDRSARFRTVIALILNGREYLFEGTVDGSILNEKRGEGGFGYDPIFVPKGYEHSFAEMASDIKNQISHRAKATQELINFLKEI